MIKGRKRDFDVSCPICKSAPQTAIHALVQCPVYARRIWEEYEDVYVKLYPHQRYIFEAAALTFNAQTKSKKPQDKYKSKLSRTVSELLIHEIWVSTCQHDHEERQVNVERSLRSIRTKITNIIKVHYRHYGQINDMNTFKNKFCINAALCSIDYHMKLNLFLPP